MKKFFTYTLLSLLTIASLPLSQVSATQPPQTSMSEAASTSETGATSEAQVTDETETATTEEETVPEFSVPAKHAIAIEVSTGKILYEQDSETVTGIASISKLLTAYMVYEAIKEGKTSLDATVTVSNYAYALSLDPTVANVPLDARAYTVESLLEAVLINSANGAAVALAEHIGGTEPRFVDAMKAKLNQWGIKDAQIVNASGLSNTYLGANIYPGSTETDENMMSARSLAIILQHLLRDYPDVTKTTSKLSAPWANNSMSSWNLLLKGATYSRPTVDGLMTGTSDLSGSSFAASSIEKNMRVVAIVLGAENVEENPHARFLAMNGLLNYVSQNYQMTTLLVEGEPYEDSKATIINGQVDQISPVAQSDFNVVIKNDATELNASYSTDEKGYQAVIKKGQQVGTLTYKDKGYLSQPPTMPMVAKKKIERAIFLKVWWNDFVNWVNEEL